MYKTIKDYDNYIIYDDGTVWNTKFDRELKGSVNDLGYKRVGLSKNGQTQFFFVHRLVAEAFVPNPNNYSIVNHKDENPSNNCADNLEWCSIEYNSNYGGRNRKLSESIKKYIKNNGCCGVAGKGGGEHPEAKKVVMCDKKTHEELRIFNSMKDAAIYLKMPSAQQNISAVCRGKKKSCGGFFWKYY